MSKQVDSPETRNSALTFYLTGFTFGVVGVCVGNLPLIIIGVIFFLIAIGYVPLHRIGTLFQSQEKDEPVAVVPVVVAEETPLLGKDEVAKKTDLDKA